MLPRWIRRFSRCPAGPLTCAGLTARSAATVPRAGDGRVLPVTAFPGPGLETWAGALGRGVTGGPMRTCGCPAALPTGCAQRELDAPPGPPSTHTSRRARARCGLPGVQPRVAMSLCAGSLTRGTSCTRGQQGAKGPASGGDLELRGDVGEGHAEALRVDGPPEGAGSRALPALLGTDGARPCVSDGHCPPRDRTRRLTAPSGLQGHLGQSGPT